MMFGIIFFIHPRGLFNNRLKINKKIVLFFDEFPWMATKNARLLQNLDYFWNQHWSRDKRVKLIICGSSASWIIEKIVNHKGGLHNRITYNMFLEPFKLYQTKKFLNHCDVKLSQKHILELYMVLGGVPFYLKKLSGQKASATQLIEGLAFKQKSFLMSEFGNLFSALFSRSDTMVEIIKTISENRYGISQESLFKRIGKHVQGSNGVNMLVALVDTGFVMQFKPLYHKKRGLYYRVIDPYTLFYFHWILPVKDGLLKKSLIRGYWDKVKTSAAWHAWSGLAFESICYEHLPKIMQALHLSPTAMPGTWRYTPTQGSDDQGAQIDLLFDRDDDAVTICEIKYTAEPWVITKAYASKLQQKVDVFKKITRTTKECFIAVISANGVKRNQYSDALLSGVVTLDDLFKAVE